MGYEIRMIIGRPGMEGDEWALSTKRYDDDSGFEPQRDSNGNIILTGRKEIYFSVYAMVDLCKLGYQDDPLNKLIADSHSKAKEISKERVYYFHLGDNPVKEDCYGEAFWPVPIREVLDAMKASCERGSYRRTDWAMALLEAMVDDKENISVLFYGY